MFPPSGLICNHSHLFLSSLSFYLQSESLTPLFLPPTLMAACSTVSPHRLVVPNKGYSSLDQSPDEKPLVALDTDR